MQDPAVHIADMAQNQANYDYMFTDSMQVYPPRGSMYVCGWVVRGSVDSQRESRSAHAYLTRARAPLPLPARAR